MALFSEIYQVTGPVARFARQIAGQGYIVAAPSSYHDFTGPEPLAYDVPGTDQGNEWKVQKARPTPPIPDPHPGLTPPFPLSDPRVLRRRLPPNRLPSSVPPHLHWPHRLDRHVWYVNLINPLFYVQRSWPELPELSRPVLNTQENPPLTYLSSTY